ncbi:actin-7-related [Anaeramoeba flamelloides]|uniref:Actin-7-related n=1 Tax=Anaeramoeba flamelloides TaxID=1746091 RepID=A0ABQ8Z329_9EUKA|nr:actin-7-related [Anaeramoeba flamelloides]
MSQAIVIDNGSAYIKAGFADDDQPRCIIPTVVGRPKNQEMNNENRIVGKEAMEKRENLTLKYPIEHGIVTNWDDVEKLWEHTFSKGLKTNPEEHKVLLTEAPLNPKANREKTVEIMFETFKVPAMYLANSAVLDLLSTGSSSGLLVQSVDDVTNIVPIFEGHALPYAVSQLDLGGRDLTDYMMKIITESKKYSFTTSSDREIVRDIKEKLGYVVLDFDQEMKRASYTKELERNYKLPTGEMIILNNERFRCTEPLFQPSLIGLEQEGIHELSFNSITKCDPSIRSTLFKNIYVTGGNGKFHGIHERLQKELDTLTQRRKYISMCVRVHNSSMMNISWTWTAGLVFVEMNENSFISKKEYEEAGASIVHRRCF